MTLYHNLSLLLLSILFTSPGLAQDSSKIARGLYDMELYSEAANEFAKQYIAADKSQKTDIAVYWFKSLNRSNQHQLTLRLLNREFGDGTTCPINMIRTECGSINLIRIDTLIKVDQWALARQFSQDLLSGSESNPETRDHLLNYLVNIQTHQRDYNAAQKSLDQLRTSKDLTMKMEVSRMEHALANRSDAKSPTLAGWLSVIPGLGHLYSGHYGEAAASFTVNAFLGWMTWEAWRRQKEVENYGSAPAIGWTLAFSVFYSGNIYSARDFTRRYNERQHRKVFEQVSRGYFARHLNQP